MTTIEVEAAKALVQAGVKGLTKLLQKVPTVFKRQGKAREQHIAGEIGRTVARLQAVTGSDLEGERARQEAAWEVLLRGLIAEYPDAVEELKTLAAEIDAAMPDTRSAGGVAGAVHAGRDAYVAGRDITINHNPDRRDSQLELSAVTLSETHPPDASSVVLDLKVRNIGGQPAVLHRATFHIHDAVILSPYAMTTFMPYEQWLSRGYLQVSHTYDINLPLPKQAADTSHNLDLSQAIEPAGTDRFHIRLGIPGPLDTIIYLLHFDIHYDKGRTVTSPAIAIAHPPGSTLDSPDAVRRDLDNFYQGVRRVRDAVDREMAVRGLSAPNWDNHPPASRADLPPNLSSVDGNPKDVFGLHSDTPSYIVNDTFWNPDRSVTQRLDDIHAYCTRIASVINGADIRHESLPRILAQAQTVLAQLPALHAEVSTPKEAMTVEKPAPSGTPDVDDELIRDVGDELIRLVGGRKLRELRERANAGEPDAAGELNNAADLADKIQRLGPDHPAALRARETLIFWRVSWDKAGAAVALTELIPDQSRVYGSDHPQTLRARHYLAMCRGETGDAAGAAAAFAELVPDRERTLGPDHPDTLNSRHELARWRAMAGDAAGAAAAFDELVADRIRVQGPDHPSTLHARRNLAVCRGKAGDAAGAAAALAELLADQVRVQGPDHTETLATQRELARWQDQAGPGSTQVIGDDLR